jgi:hypothetical protein
MGGGSSSPPSLQDLGGAGSEGRAVLGRDPGAEQDITTSESGLPGLVHIVTSDSRINPWTEFENARRLSKMRRRTITRSRIQTEEVGADVAHPHYVDLVTLTYAPGHSWDPWHITNCVKAYRDQAARDGVHFRYEWVAELQLKRMRRSGESAAECLHYHAIVWQPEGYAFPHPDTRGWWPHGMSNTEAARNPVGYLAKYASKGTEGEPLPRGARISGGGGLSNLGRQLVSWWLRPRYVRDAFPDFMRKVRRVPGGGWADLDTGEWLRAPSYDGSTWNLTQHEVCDESEKTTGS